MSTEERSVNQPEEQPSLSEQRLIRRAKLKELQDAGQDPFQITKFVVKHHSADIKEGFEALEGAMTSVAGRIMSKRGMGKAVFCDLQDGKGRIQLYVRVDELGEEAFAKFKKTDIGDIVGVEGEVFKTKRGEISVKAHKVTLLSKSLQPLPEKFHGLTDKEMRYRQRYVDLIMNEDVRRAFRIRTAFIKHMRRYLDERDYLEVETPVLNTISGGATARPFITHHNTLDIDMYMRIATELNLKRLTVGGFERVYEIGPVFRAEKHATQRHLNEYTSLDLEMGFLRSFTDLMALEMMPQPPKERAANNPWPEWPRVLKVDYGQTECLAKFGKDPRVYQTTVKEFLKDEAGNLTGAVISYLKPQRDPDTGRTSMVPTGEEFTYDCQLAFIAAGFVGCEDYVAEAFGVERNARGNVADQSFRTNVDKVFVCGDMRRGQSLVVWGLREGRDCAAEVDRYLMGYTNL